jgi:hypothetical protein
MENRLEGVQHLRVLGIDEGRGGDDVVGRWGGAVAGPDGGGASVGDIDESRRGDDGGGQGGCGVSGTNSGDADVREVDECRRWDDGGASVGLYKDSCPTALFLLDNIACTLLKNTKFDISNACLLSSVFTFVPPAVDGLASHRVG